MAKTNGLGDNFYVGGYDLSGDVGAVSKIAGPLSLLDVTGINKSAHERIGGERSGEIGFDAWFNPSAGQAHPVLSALPSVDTQLMYCRGAAIGNPAACLYGRQVNYDGTIAQNGAFPLKVDAISDGFGLEWGEQLTAGKITASGASQGAYVQHNPRQVPVTVNIASVAVANPGQVNTSTPHGLVTGDSVTITGTATTPNINLPYTVTVINATQFTIPVNVTAGQAGAGGTVQQTSTDFGCAAYLQVFSFAGTDATVRIEHVGDSNNSPVTVTGGTFAQITGGAPLTQRIVTGLTLPIQDFVRYAVITTGGFSSLVFAVAFVRYYTATAF